MYQSMRIDQGFVIFLKISANTLNNFSKNKKNLRTNNLLYLKIILIKVVNVII